MLEPIVEVAASPALGFVDGLPASTVTLSLSAVLKLMRQHKRVSLIAEPSPDPDSLAIPGRYSVSAEIVRFDDPWSVHARHSSTLPGQIQPMSDDKADQTYPAADQDRTDRIVQTVRDGVR